ncbi:MAG: TIGR04376 family protein [Leptolyngbyaceae cyanobacterium CSU_1_3]|nr:TIGR04376 family protein [Leptolyngbyaceae cyanobacterium CSU_1_3]
MGLFDDFSRFLESRLDEFLQNNPHLELQALEEKLREQEQETLRLMADLQLTEKRLQEDILTTAQEIQRWHIRIEKAKLAGRMDLAEPAQAHEASLLREGNQKWGQMEILKERLKQTEALQRKIQTRRQEVQTELTQAQTTRVTQAEQRWAVNAWNQSPNHIHNSADPLEQQFSRWEAQEELEQMKRKMGK